LRDQEAAHRQSSDKSDGFLTSASVRQSLSPSDEAAVGRLFAALDTDNSGLITIEKMVGVFVHPGGLEYSTASAMEYVRCHDGDGDGGLNRHEFQTALKVNQRLDAFRQDVASILEKLDDKAAEQVVRSMEPVLRKQAAKSTQGGWAGMGWCDRLACALPFVPPSERSLVAQLAEGRVAFLDPSASEEVKSHIATMEAAEKERRTRVAEMQARSAERQARLAAEEETTRIERQRKVAEAKAQEQALKDAWRAMSPSERQAKMQCMCSSDALLLGLTSGVGASYDCPVDQWGNCTGCREHDI